MNYGVIREYKLYIGKSIPIISRVDFHPEFFAVHSTYFVYVRKFVKITVVYGCDGKSIEH